MPNIDYHAGMNHLFKTLEAGLLGRVEYVGSHSGKHDQPSQHVLRDINTGRVDMADLYSDGLIVFRGKNFPYN